MHIYNIHTHSHTGWSTSVPMYHPERVIDAVASLVRLPSGTSWDQLPPLTPWFSGFKGECPLLLRHEA